MQIITRHLLTLFLLGHCSILMAVEINSDQEGGGDILSVTGEILTPIEPSDLSLANLENRSQITSNILNHAKSYKKLFYKYKKDIYLYCSKKEISHHYYLISKKFYLAHSFSESKKNIIKALKKYPSVKNLFFFVLVLLRMQK